MTVAVHIFSPDGVMTTDVIATGETFAVAPDQRVELPDVALGEASLATTEGDLLAVTVNGETVFFGDLISHIENETGAEIAFADGHTIATLGELLAYAGDDMTDLVEGSDAVADLFDLGNGVAAGFAGAPPAADEAGTLSTADLLVTKIDADGVVPGLESVAADSELNDGVWAGTEAAKTEWTSVANADDDQIDTFIGGIDDIV